MEDEATVSLDGKTLGNLRVVDLKQELEKRGLSKSGSKKDLIKRLKQQLEFEKLCEERKAAGEGDVKLELDAATEQNEFVQQYLAQQQKLFAEQNVEKHVSENEETQTSDEDESSDTQQADERKVTEGNGHSSENFQENEKRKPVLNVRESIDNGKDESVDVEQIEDPENDSSVVNITTLEDLSDPSHSCMQASTDMEPATQCPTVPYSLSDIQLPESPGKHLTKPFVSSDKDQNSNNPNLAENDCEMKTNGIKSSSDSCVKNDSSSGIQESGISKKPAQAESVMENVNASTANKDIESEKNNSSDESNSKMSVTVGQSKTSELVLLNVDSDNKQKNMPNEKGKETSNVSEDSESDKSSDSWEHKRQVKSSVKDNERSRLNRSKKSSVCHNKKNERSRSKSIESHSKRRHRSKSRSPESHSKRRQSRSKSAESHSKRKRRSRSKSSQRKHALPSKSSIDRTNKRRQRSRSASSTDSHSKQVERNLSRSSADIESKRRERSQSTSSGDSHSKQDEHIRSKASDRQIKGPQKSRSSSITKSPTKEVEQSKSKIYVDKHRKRRQWSKSDSSTENSSKQIEQIKSSTDVHIKGRQRSSSTSSTDSPCKQVEKRKISTERHSKERQISTSSTESPCKQVDKSKISVEIQSRDRSRSTSSTESPSKQAEKSKISTEKHSKEKQRSSNSTDNYSKHGEQKRKNSNDAQSKRQRSRSASSTESLSKESRQIRSKTSVSHSRREQRSKSNDSSDSTNKEPSNSPTYSRRGKSMRSRSRSSDGSHKDKSRSRSPVNYHKGSDVEESTQDKSHVSNDLCSQRTESSPEVQCSSLLKKEKSDKGNEESSIEMVDCTNVKEKPLLSNDDSKKEQTRVPIKQRLKIKRDNVIHQKSSVSESPSAKISPAKQNHLVKSKPSEQPMTPEVQKKETNEVVEILTKPYVSRKVTLSNRKLSQSSVDEKNGEPKQKKSKWGNLASIQKNSQSINISSSALKNWFPDFKLMKEPASMNELTPEEHLSPVKEDKYQNPLSEDLINNEFSSIKRTTLPIKESFDYDMKPLPMEEPQEQGPVSNLIFIQNLVRPFTLLQLKDLLRQSGNISEEHFWIDKIKSKCIVMYDTEEEAINARKALNNTRWPPSNPKILNVEFTTVEDLEFHKKGFEPPKPVPEASVEQVESFEVRTVLPIEVPKRKEREHRKEREKLKPLQPVREWDKDKIIQDSPERDHVVNKENEKIKTSDKKEKKESKRRPNEDTPAKLLDDLFQKTKASPCIYWLPLTDEQVKERDEAKRLKRLEREKRVQKEKEEEENDRRNKPARVGHRSREREQRRSSSRSRSPVARRR